MLCKQAAQYIIAHSIRVLLIVTSKSLHLELQDTDTYVHWEGLFFSNLPFPPLFLLELRSLHTRILASNYTCSDTVTKVRPRKKKCFWRFAQGAKYPETAFKLQKLANFLKWLNLNEKDWTELSREKNLIRVSAQPGASMSWPLSLFLLSLLSTYCTYVPTVNRATSVIWGTICWKGMYCPFSSRHSATISRGKNAGLGVVCVCDYGRACKNWIKFALSSRKLFSASPRQFVSQFLSPLLVPAWRGGTHWIHYFANSTWKNSFFSRETNTVEATNWGQSG